MESEMKVCSTCGRTLPRTSEFFYRRSGQKLRGTCKSCRDERQAAYRDRHPERAAACRKRWREENIEKAREIQRGWKRSHPDAERAYRIRYYAERPGLGALYAHNRRARVRGAAGSHTLADVLAQHTRQKGRCYWCHEKVGEKYHVDHVVPLALGGSNGPENLVIACPACNQAKHAKHPMDFAGQLC